MGQIFLRELRFPLPNLITQMLHTRLPSGAGTVGPLAVAVPTKNNENPAKLSERCTGRHELYAPIVSTTSVRNAIPSNKHLATC
jgi:hypothetical protein